MAAPRRWPVPPLSTTSALASWLGVTAGELDWFADRRGIAARSDEPRLRHYLYRWTEKRAGGWRLLEIPRPRLRAIQRRILDEIVGRIPPHDAAHGFRRGRSALTHAALHAGRAVVIRLDLEAFFPSIAAGRVYGVFRRAGYPEEVARTLTALATHRAPPRVVRAATRRMEGATTGDGDLALQRSESWRDARRLAVAHLPQGAPSSPVLANLCAFRLDVRLATLAARVDARYSRYADDLALSGDAELGRRAARLVAQVAAICADEGFRLNHRKTRIQRASARQELVGLTVNVEPNLSRHERKRLEAILTNCVRRGPASQNRAEHPSFRAYVEGRVAWVTAVNPRHGAHFHALLDAIDWDR